MESEVGRDSGRVQNPQCWRPEKWEVPAGGTLEQELSGGEHAWGTWCGARVVERWGLDGESCVCGCGGGGVEVEESGKAEARRAAGGGETQGVPGR